MTTDERLDAAYKVAESMRACENGMCGHCIELLCEKLLPLLGALDEEVFRGVERPLRRDV